MQAGKKPSLYDDLVNVSSLGIELVVSVLIGAGGGFLLDRWLGTKPWFLVIGAAFGAAAGLRDAYRIIVKSNKDKKDKDAD